MAWPKISVGSSDFAEYRKGDYYYVDKTGLIEELLKTPGIKVTLITRPRRFGKTMNMSMLAEFFDIRKDSRPIFSGLKIADNKELCEAWMNQWPVIHVTFRSVFGSCFKDAYSMIEAVIAELYKQHIYLLENPEMMVYDREIFDRIAGKKASGEEIKNSLLFLTRLLGQYYGKTVILLIDEYDVPLAKASDKGYYEEMLYVIRGILQALKDNSFLHLAVVTGCLRIAKESIFTGTNNFITDTISDNRLDEFFGFTQEEVDRILADTQNTSHSQEIKNWYDGYRFGSIDVYSPWDVMNHINALCLDPQALPRSYWRNTSDNAIIRSFIDQAENDTIKQFEILLSGDKISQKIEEDLTYDYLHASAENLWSILYLTGYLTGTEKEEGRQEWNLWIPNLEIREIFEDTVIKWFHDSARLWERKALFHAIWERDEEKLTEEMTKLLRKTISYHDYKEDFYHAFLAGIFAGAGYIVKSNREHGDGRSDVVVQDYDGNRIAVFEVKYSRRLEDLPYDCERAIKQIDVRRYGEEFAEDYSTVICYGIAFYRKRCMVKVKPTSL
ncbi:AAA family ATPase [Enterocloster sp.]|uniref:AAA family ATPase n=1 Tax=Enterocloster sp. TaxID=2719315 RepID=UPI003AB86BAC